jgi:hypothetical protein
MTTYLQRKRRRGCDSEQKSPWDEFDQQAGDRRRKWIRTGIKRPADPQRGAGPCPGGDLRRDRQARREQMGTVRLAAQEAERSGQAW